MRKDRTASRGVRHPNGYCPLGQVDQQASPRASRGLVWKVRFRGEVSRSSRKIFQLPAAYPCPGAWHEHHIPAHFGKFDEAISADTKVRMLTGEKRKLCRRKETALSPYNPRSTRFARNLVSRRRSAAWVLKKRRRRIGLLADRKIASLDALARVG